MRKVVNIRISLFMFLVCVFSILSALLINVAGLLVGIPICLFLLSVCLILVKIVPNKFKFDKKMVFLLLGFVGIVTFTVSNYQIKAFNNSENNEIQKVSCVVERISIVDNNYKIVFRSASYSNFNNKKLLYYGDEINVKEGDHIEFYAKLKPIILDFNSEYLFTNLSDNIQHQVVVLHGLKKVKSSDNIFVKSRDKIKSVLINSLSTEVASVLIALTVGDTTYIENQTLTSFRLSGIAHIFAVSGLHITFLSVILLLLLKNKPYFLNILIIIPIIVFYSGICYFSVSSIRACLMTALTLILTYKGKRADGLSVLFTSAVITLMFSPLSLFNLSFIYSYFIVFCIIVYYPVVFKRLVLKNYKLKSSIALVLTVQIGSFPISLVFFNNYAIIGTVLNVVFIPLIGIIYPLTLFGVVIGMLIPLISPYLLLLPAIIIKFIIDCVNFIPVREIVYVPNAFNISIGLYIMLVLLNSGLIKVKKKLLNTINMLFLPIFIFFSLV